MNIHIEVIPHDEQRYPTAGDWFFTDEWVIPPGTEMGPSTLWTKRQSLQIRVSALSDWRREVLIAIHELVEVVKCKHDGVTQEAVDAFDMQFEKYRQPDNFDEPGDSPGAPYQSQHCLATGIERIMAKELEVVWSDYEKELENLP